MAETWTTVKAADVKEGDFIRYRGAEFEVAHIEVAFMGRDGMLAFIEDNSERWMKYPAGADAELELRQSS
jgi:hypothetical protein